MDSRDALRAREEAHEELAAAALAALGEALELASEVEEIGEIIDVADAVIADSDGELRERAEAFAAKAEAKRQRMLAPVPSRA